MHCATAKHCQRVATHDQRAGLAQRGGDVTATGCCDRKLTGDSFQPIVQRRDLPAKFLKASRLQLQRRLRRLAASGGSICGAVGQFPLRCSSIFKIFEITDDDHEPSCRIGCRRRSDGGNL